MKRIIGMMVALVLTVSFLGVGVAHATGFKGEQNITVAANEVIDSSLYAGGNMITIAGTVEGDLFCAGQTVEITGTVKGDILCAAQNLRVEGTVFGDVRVAAQSATIGGTIDGALTAAGQSVYVASQALIGKDASVFGSSIQFAGKVGRDMVASADTLMVSAEVTRNADITARDLTLAGDARINGNLVYTSNKQADVKEGAVVAGSTERKDPPQQHEERQESAFSRYIVGPAYLFAAMLFVGLAGLVAAPRMAEQSVHMLQSRPLASLGLGFVALVVTPVAAVVLMVTFIGIPLGIVVLLLWMLSLLSGFVIASYCAGTWVSQKLGVKRWHRAIAMAIGLLAVIVLSMIPFVGALVVLATIAWGMGSQLLAWRAHTYGDSNKKSAKAKA